MDAMPHDRRDALGEADPEVERVADTAERTPPARVGIDLCSRCRFRPGPGCKQRYCGRCKIQSYCSQQCARADWADHKPVCESLRRSTEEALALFEAQGGRKQDFNKNGRDIVSWFAEVPGLLNEIQLLAWNHRKYSPLLIVSTSHGDVDGREARAEMITRSFWEKDSRLFDTHPPDDDREIARQQFGAASFCPEKQYVAVHRIRQQPGKPGYTIWTNGNFNRKTIIGAKIVEALTAASRAEDLASAFAWIDDNLPQRAAEELLQNVRNRSASPHSNDSSSQGSALVTSRPINNEIAFLIMHSLKLEFEIRLTGLRSAANLNGREGVIHGQDLTSPERWRARLENGTYVSVKAEHFAHIRRGCYKRRSPWVTWVDIV